MSTPSTAASGYFVDQKKGEVNELKQLLKNINVERDVKRKREIIKKVIAYMTLGIDVSRLLTDMIMAIETKDIVIKKMVYLYLCNYAHKEPEMAIMCINTLRRDCDNEDPMVRGLALRSLCNLRLLSIMEYVEQPIQKSLTDISPYVRKTGVLGILKLNDISPTFAESHNYIQQLYGMLQDVDANVVTNVIHVLNELQLSDGGLQLTQQVVMMLLNRLGEFSEWGLNSVLELVSRYKPRTEDETFAIMNLLDPVLRTANSGAVLATIKCFLMLTAGFPDILPQIYARTKPPMLTFVTGSNSEVQFAVLKHLQLILLRNESKGIFDSEFRQLFVRYNEPSHVKQMKIDLLPLVANDANAKDIATELGEYVVDVDSELSRRSIFALGEIAIRVPSVANDIATSLIELVDFDISYVRAQAVRCLVSVVRVLPFVRSLVLPVIPKCLRKVEDPDAKSSIIWLLGEFGEEILESPYHLEPLIDNYDDEQSAAIKLQLLASTTTLFFKRPPEMHSMLGRLLSAAVNDTGNQDVHDRALLYYRLLSSHQLEATKSLFNHSVLETSGNPESFLFAEDLDDDLRQKIFKEFNTLAVIYGAPSPQFIDEKYQVKLTNAPAVDDAFSSFGGSSSLSTSSASDSLAANPTPAVPISAGNTINLLDLDSDGSVPAPAAPQATSLSIALKADTMLTPQQFQQLWVAMPDIYNGQVGTMSRSMNSTAELEAVLRGSNISTMASGALGGNDKGFKLFLFAFEDNLTQQMPFLVQLIVNTATGDITAVIKAQTSPQAINAFMEMFVGLLGKF